ncbi:MAG: nucleotide exchange factor GrpE [Firmicutes bacterium]|nr:nucleotide exchange factor GrpE [Bacillota bacterium]
MEEKWKAQSAPCEGETASDETTEEGAPETTQVEEEKEQVAQEPLDARRLQALQDEVAQLQQALQASQRAAAEAQDRWLRVQADFDNYRKRMAREREQTSKYAVEQLVKELLPVLDNLERTLTAARANSDMQTLLQGVHMVLDQLRAGLARFGVSEIDAEGQPFDPTQHEAIEEVDDPNAEAGAVVAQLQRGYRLHDRVIRPALVKVAKS